MQKFLNRADATAFLRERGIDVGDLALANLASDGKGPRYALINGRACYQPEWLLSWIQEQVAKPVTRRRKSARGASTTARA